LINYANIAYTPEVRRLGIALSKIGTANANELSKLEYDLSNSPTLYSYVLIKLL